jgi:myo-inositol-1(or 4)-monophosphatase
MNYQELCNETIEIARNTGKYIYAEQGKHFLDNMKSKGKHNFVTEVDRGAEEQIVESLQKLIPDAGFITEEGTSNKKGKVYNCIIDPLDGTTNFIHGAPPVAVSIALMENEEIVIGVVNEIFLGECFYTWKNGPAFMNGKILNVSQTKRVNDSLIATGFPYQNFDRIKPFMQSLEYFFNHSHGVRRLGSAATDLAYIAAGRYDAFYEYNLNPWDIAAGTLLIRQAGGKSADFSGGNDYLFGKELVSANSQIFDEFLEVVGSFMNK